jgi:hypothetical protein
VHRAEEELLLLKETSYSIRGQQERLPVALVDITDDVDHRTSSF